MNIFCVQGQGANFHIMKFFVDGFKEAGHNVFFHDVNTRSVYDAFHEFELNNKIDIYFGTTWQLSNAVLRNLIARPYIKVILRADHYGDLDNIDRTIYPIGIADDNQKTLVETLKKNHPNFLWMTSQYSDSEMKRSLTHYKWENIGVKMMGIPLAANLSDYYYTKPTKENECNVTFCGGAWGYKNKYLSWLHSLTYPTAPLSCRIFGDGWSSVACAGRATEETVRNHYASAHVCPCLYEPHSTEVYSDISLRPFQVSACHGFALSHNAIGLRELFNEEEMVTFEDRKDFVEKAIYYIKNPEERKTYMDKACLRVYKDHTNFHRCGLIFHLLGYGKEADRCLEIANVKYNEVKDKINANTN